MTIEEIIHRKKFPNEEYEPNNFNDWAKENLDEAYPMCLEIAEEQLNFINMLKKDIVSISRENVCLQMEVKRLKK